MARHAAPRKPPARRALLRAGLVLGAAGTALAGAAGTAGAAEPAPLTDTALGALDVPSALGAVSDLKLNPLAGTGVDPTDNALGTQVADFQPVSTGALTAPLSDGDSLSELPLVGGATSALLGR